MLKVLISDSVAAEGAAVLERAPGIELINRPGLKPAELIEAIADVDGLAHRGAHERMIVDEHHAKRVRGRARA